MAATRVTKLTVDARLLKTQYYWKKVDHCNFTERYIQFRVDASLIS